MTGKTIIYLPNWLGDMVMATPFLLALRQSTDGEIWATGKPSAMHLYNGLNLFNRFIPYDGKGVIRFLDLMSAIQACHFDRGIVLPHSFRSALLFFLGRVRERIGYDRNQRGVMLTRTVNEKGKGPEPTVEHYLRVLEVLGIGRVGETPCLRITDDEDRRFDERFSEVDDSYAVFIVGAQYGPSKCWPDTYFSELADLIIGRLSTPVYLLPGRGEEKIARRIREGARYGDQIKIKDMDVREMKVCLSRASLVVTNDTGPRHIAAALSVPTIVILGSMDERYTVYPNDFTYAIAKDIPCRPCNKRQCDRDHECLKGIRPEEVLYRVEEVFRGRQRRAD